MGRGHGPALPEVVLRSLRQYSASRSNEGVNAGNNGSGGTTAEIPAINRR